MKREHLLILLAAVLGAIAYPIIRNQPTPRVAMGSSQGGIYQGGDDDLWPQEEGDHYCPAEYILQAGHNPTLSRHRYPHRVGHEITTFIEQGMPALNRPAVRDYDWIASPPSEATL